MCKYFGYIRVSTETQSEKGYGIETQKTAIKEYAKKNGITITDIYQDAGISGNIHDDGDESDLSRRNGLMDLLAALEHDDTIIILNTSRLWRSDMAKALVRRELIKHKARVISIEQPRYDLYATDPNDYLINAIMEALDVYERMSISIKLAHGRSTKARGGDKPAGICPYGYRYAGDKKSVEIDPSEAEIIRKIFSMAQKGMTLRQIADDLNAEGVLTRRGKEWQRGTLHAICRNRFYTGILIHDGKEYAGNHEAIISKIQFGKVQAALMRRHK